MTRFSLRLTNELYVDNARTADEAATSRHADLVSDAGWNDNAAIGGHRDMIRSHYSPQLYVNVEYMTYLPIGPYVSA